MADAAVKQANAQEFKEVTIKFGKGFVGEPFTSKEGKSLVQIKIPNEDPSDKRPWQTFVVPENRVHEDKFGNGMWMKLPENGSTTVRRSIPAGQDENGKTIWSEELKKIPNTELKGMVEFYKNNDRSKELTQENSQTQPKTEKAPEKKDEKKPSLKSKLKENTKAVEKAKAAKALEPKEKSTPELPFK